MSIYDYQSIENLLLRLLGLKKGIFTESEECEVLDFINAGEYGLALETLVGIVAEESKQINGKSLVLVCELADAMKMDRNFIEEELLGLVKDS